MHRFHFNLLTLFGFVAVIAVGCAALARPSPFWLVVVSSLSIACLFYAVLAAVYGRNAGRAFWVGFVIVGWGYVALEWATSAGAPFYLPTDLVTGGLQSLIHAQSPQTLTTVTPYASVPSVYPTWLPQATYDAPPPSASIPGPYPTWPPSATYDAPAAVADGPAALPEACEPSPTNGQIEMAPTESPPAVFTTETAPFPGPSMAEFPVASTSYGYAAPLWTSANPEYFHPITRWLWSPWLGFAGGLVALRRYHRRERQVGQKSAVIDGCR